MMRPSAITGDEKMRAFGWVSRTAVHRGAPVWESRAWSRPAPSPMITLLSKRSGESSTIDPVTPIPVVTGVAHRSDPSVVSTARTVPSHAPNTTVSPNTAGVLVTPLTPSTRHRSTRVPASAGEIAVSVVLVRLLPASNP